FNTQTLHLSFPQAAMMMTARGTVDPSRWDEGIDDHIKNALTVRPGRAIPDGSHFCKYIGSTLTGDFNHKK
ncbi:FimD/PapC N-terminal domain-containing protein, partial [Escherichia coli]